MATTQKVVLLACGSYNPPTNMHLRMFELARDYLQRSGKYNVIAGIMSPVSDGYNKKDLASSKHRCEMVKLSLKSSKWIRLDKWESEQPQWLETAIVLAHHRARLTNQAITSTRPAPTKKRKKDKNNEVFNFSDVIERNAENSSPRHCTKDDSDTVQLKLLCGGDLLESFAVPGLWKDEDIEEIVGKYGLVCITRNGSDPRKFIYESDVLTRHQEDIHIVTEWIQNEVSSTKIRRALRRSESVKYLLQDSVIDYIRQHQLYGYKCDNKYCATPSPSYDIMDYVDCDLPNSPMVIQTKEGTQKSSLKLSDGDLKEDDIAKSPKQQDCKEVTSPRIMMVPSGSPRRMMETEIDSDSSNSPKTVQNMACMADLGTIVRRVRNVRIGFTPETRVFAYTATETCV